MPAAGCVGVGVFGTGPLTNVLVPYLNRLGFRVVALWAPSADSARQTAGELLVPFHTCNMDEVLLHHSVELVLVLAPPALHARVVVKALGIGKHVLCERPLGAAQCDVARMVAAARYYPSLVSAVAGLSWRHLPAVRELRRVIGSGELGTLVWLEGRILCGPLVEGGEYGWHCARAAGGGALATLGLPLIDLVQFVSGWLTVRAIGSLRRSGASAGEGGECQQLPRHRQLTADSVCSCQLELSGGQQADVPLLASVSVAAQLELGSSVQLQLLVCGSRGHAQLVGEKLTLSVAGQTESLSSLRQPPVSVGDLIRQSSELLKESSLLPRLTQLGWLYLLAEMSELRTSARTSPAEDESSEQDADREAVRGLQCPGDTAELGEAQQLVAVLEAVRQSVQQRGWCQVALMSI